MYVCMYVHVYVRTYICSTYVCNCVLYVHLTYCYVRVIQPQYVFIHDALLESVECGETEVVARDLKGQYRFIPSMLKQCCT